LGKIAENSFKKNVKVTFCLQLKMSNSVQEHLEKSCLSRGLSEALEQLMQLVVRDCIIVWMYDITSDHARIKQQLM